jgi:hypothetical protein
MDATALFNCASSLNRSPSPQRHVSAFRRRINVQLDERGAFVKDAHFQRGQRIVVEPSVAGRKGGSIVEVRRRHQQRPVS